MPDRKRSGLAYVAFAGILVGNAKVIQTYERAPRAPQLVVTTRIDMRGRQVSVRRVYDAVTR